LPFFRKTFLKLKPHIEAYQTKGAIYQGKARFFGDQYAKSVDELQVNTKEDLSAGKWKWKFAFAPVPATEYIEGFVTPSDLVTIEGILRGNNQEFNVI
jgi:phage tail sheath protein FI